MSGRGRDRGSRRRDGYRRNEGAGAGAGGVDGRGPRDNRDRDKRRRGGDRRDYEEGNRETEEQEPTSRVLRSENTGTEDQERKQIILAKSERVVEREKVDKLDQEFPALRKMEISPSKVFDGREEGEVPGVIMVKQRESNRSESPGVQTPRIFSKKETGQEKTVPRLMSPVKLVDESHTFCDGLAEYMTDNQDFTVIGVLGLQNTGKSTILNILGKNCPEDEEIFRVQTYEHQMLAEHCTNGIDIYINSRRYILLDCQPLLSSSIMDRSIQLEKKFNAEFSTAENTIEVQSLQLIGFIFSICHVVLLVQDWVLDFSLIRLIQAAETLKPVTPTVSGEDNQVTEYFPHLVLVHNKCEVADFEDDVTDEIRDLYGMVFSKSRLSWKDEEQDIPNLVLVPDLEGERAEILHHRIKPRVDLERAGRGLRQKVFSLPRRPLSQGKLTEKAWLNLATRTWDNIKNSPFYMEYSRLLP